MSAELAANVLLNAETLAQRLAHPAISALNYTLYLVVRQMVCVPEVHTPVRGAPEKVSETVKAEVAAKFGSEPRLYDNGRDVYINRKVAVTRPTLDVEQDEFGFPVEGVPCTCEKDKFAAGLYLHREYGQPLMSPEDWDITSDGLSRYYSMPKSIRAEWLDKPGVRQRHVRGYFLYKSYAEQAMAECNAETHFRSLDLAQELSGSPEVAVAETTAIQGLPEDDFYTQPFGPKVKSKRKYARKYGVPSVTGFVKTPASDSAIQQSEDWQDAEFNKGRSSVIPFHPVDADRGYQPDVITDKLGNVAEYAWNAERVAVEDSIVRGEMLRRKERGDVWLDSRRGHGKLSTYVQVQRRKDKAAALAKSRQVEKLCALIYGKVDPSRIQAKIAATGSFDAAVEWFKVYATIQGFEHPATRTTILT